MYLFINICKQYCFKVIKLQQLFLYKSIKVKEIYIITDQFLKFYEPKADSTNV